MGPTPLRKSGRERTVKGKLAYTVVPDGHIFYFKGLADRKECVVGFLINKSLAGRVKV